MSYRRLLLATDLSEPSGAAARLARRLAEPDAEMQAVFVASTAMEAIEGRPGSVVAMAQAREEARRVLAAWLDRQGLKDVEAVVLAGSAGREIAAHASAMRADLLALGARGQSALERILLGSTARVVLRGSRVDTLVARGDREPRRVMVATDFSEPAGRAVGRAALLAERLGLEVHLVHVLDTSLWADALRGSDAHDARSLVPIAEEKLKEIARSAFRGKAFPQVARGRPGVDIPRLAEELRVDLLVIGDHGAGALERAMMGSVAEAVAERAPCSVLMVRSPPTA